MSEAKTNFDLNTLHVLADFDRTFTVAHIDGKKTPSLISVLRDNNFLDEDYATTAHQYFNHYSGFETDQSLSFAERKALMHERRSRHFNLLIEKGLSKLHINQVVTGGYIQLRQGAATFLKKTYAQGVPVVFISSSGLGSECISQFLHHEGVLLPHMHIISNEYIRSDDGVALGVHQPIIHALNKDETTLTQFPFYDAIKNRKNVLLLGDSLGDLSMIEGFAYDSLTTLGFLNDLPHAAIDKKNAYNDAFDYVIEGDSSFDRVHQIYDSLVKN